MSIIKKQEMVTEVADVMSNNRFILIGENKGLKVADIDKLRKHGRNEKVFVKVMKNSLLKRALTSLPDIDNHLVGQNIIAISNEELTATKLFQDFITLTKLIDFKVAYVDNKMINVSELKELAKIESREHLYARLAQVLSLSIGKK